MSFTTTRLRSGPSGPLVGAVLALMALAAPARAENLDQLAARVTSIVRCAADAGENLRTGNRAAAVGELQNGDSQASALQDATALSGVELGAKRARFERLLIKLRRQFQRSLIRTNDATAQPWSAQRAISRVSSAAYAADVFLQRTQARGVTLQELRARSAGVHDPQRVVLFKVQVGRSAGDADCDETPVITVTDSSGAGAVVPGFIERRVDRRGNRVVQVTMGTAGGQARVQVTACGVTRTWLLFNRGDRNEYPVLPKPTVARFDGTYTGTFSGSAKIPGLGSEPVSGGVSMVITGGVILIDEPGSGRGKVASSGRSRFVGGGGVAAGARYSFSGKFTQLVVGGVSGGGTWFATFPGGTARGTWSVGRN